MRERWSHWFSATTPKSVSNSVQDENEEIKKNMGGIVHGWEKFETRKRKGKKKRGSKRKATNNLG